MLLFVGVYDIVDDIDGQDLIVLVDDVLMFEYLWVLIFVIEVDGFKAIGARDGVINETIFTVAV